MKWTALNAIPRNILRGRTIWSVRVPGSTRLVSGTGYYTCATEALNGLDRARQSNPDAVLFVSQPQQGDTMKFTYNNIPTEKLSGPLFIVSTPSSLEVFDNETEAKAVAATHFSANNGKSPVLVYALKHVVKPVVPEVKFEAAKQE